MGFYNNIGNDIDIANSMAQAYIDGAAKVRKWKKNVIIPRIESYFGKKWNDETKEYFTTYYLNIMLDGINDSMIDDTGHLDKNVSQLFLLKEQGFIRGWDACSRLHEKMR